VGGASHPRLQDKAFAGWKGTMQEELAFFKDFVRSRNLRWTYQRQVVLKVLLKMRGHFKLKTLQSAVREVDRSIGIATLYRTINLLIQSGLLNEITSLDGKKIYEHSFKHHDHMVCNQCGVILEFEHPLIEKLQSQVCRDYDFTLLSHQMVLYGQCAQCRN